MWPRVSNVIVAMIGMSADTWRTPWIAAPISDRCDIVSIQITSTPPAMSAAACSAKTSTASSSDSVPSGAMISPVGPMSPATSARPPAASTSSRRRIAAVRFSSPTRSCEAVEPEPKAVAAERVRHDDPRARLEVAALDPPNDLRLADVPDLRRIAELEARREQHRAHRPVGEDRAALVEQGAPARVRRTRLGGLEGHGRAVRWRTGGRARLGVRGVGGARARGGRAAGAVARAPLGAVAHQRLIDR